MITKVTFGSDPEYFLRNKDTGKIVSSINIVEGTKSYPKPLGDGFFILKDNILVEGNIPPTSNKKGFISNMEELKRRIEEYVQVDYPTLEVYHSDCEDLDMAFLSHPEAMEFGCSPYLNAWDDETHKAKDLSSESYRTCGTHIHIGYEIEKDVVWSQETINQIIAKAFDLFVIIPSCLVNVDKRRFENYGGLGQYRDTTYGLECRSLGGFFSKSEYLPWVFDQTVKTLEFIKSEENLYKLMVMEKPTASFKGGKFYFDSSIYTSLGLDFNKQLILTKNTVNA